jgi:hypothetical protein
VETDPERQKTRHGGSFTFVPPRQPGYYLGRVTFGGTPLILPGRDADMYLGAFSPARPALTFAQIFRS